MIGNDRGTMCRLTFGICGIRVKHGGFSYKGNCLSDLKARKVSWQLFRKTISGKL